MDLLNLRQKLDRLNEQIIGRIKDRSRLPLNQAIYRADAVRIQGERGISFLDFAIRGLEAYHASLGRYNNPDQHPLSGQPVPASPVERVVDTSVIKPADLTAHDEIIRFYLTLLPEFCSAGDDPFFYGETTFIDADLLLRIHERINVGPFVAHTKLQQDPALAKLAQQVQVLRARLQDSQREQEVIAKASQTAARYGLDPELIARVFRWIIRETLDVEVRTVQQIGTLNEER